MPDVSSVIAVELGDAVRADRRQADGRSSRCRRSAPACGSSSSRANPDYPIWAGCYWGTRPRCRRWRCAGNAGRARTSSLQTPLQNGLVISDLPGPTGGIMLKSTTGATIIVNDTGIYIQNGKGARS